MREEIEYYNPDINPITGKKKPRKRDRVFKQGFPIKKECFSSTPAEVVEKNLKILEERIRYRGVRVVKGYKFDGVIPTPKEISYYQL